MAILDLNLHPDARALSWFGVLLGFFFAIVGGLTYRYAGSLLVPSLLWGIGAVACIAYYGVRPLRVPMYRGWMRAAYPIGWTVSHALLAVTYYLVLTPIGLAFRILRRDPLQRRWIQGGSYWTERRSESPSRYFRQF